jgi:hypothetical protein
MKTNSTQNQQNPPLPKRKRVDAQGNDRRRFIAKDSGTTMILVEGLTENGCKVLENSFRNTVERLGGKVKVNFKPIR